MGSLSSRPSVPAPARQQTVFVPQQTQTVQASSVTQTSNSGDTNNESERSSALSESENRQETLLRRNRGRLGTVLTGLSGVLSPVSSQGRKKTLLGE